jgi:hypothetical protein
MPAELPSFWEVLRDKLANQPALIGVARQNCRRWLEQGHSAPERLRAWETLLTKAESQEAAREQLLKLLTAEDEPSARLREFHPFAGVLTREERRQTRELCGYRH